MHAHPPKLPPAIRRPRATAPVVLTMGQTVQIGSSLYIVGPGLIPQGAAPPTPPPTPLPPSLAGYKNAATGQATTTAAPGDLLLLETAGLPTLIPGAAGRVLLSGIDAAVLAWQPTEVEIKVPPLPTGPVTVKLYYESSPAAYPQLLIGAGPPLSISAAPPPPPPPPPPVPAAAAPRGHAWLHRDLTPVTVAQPGEDLTLLGEGFGGAIGRVWFSGIEQTVVAWTDTRIVFTLAARPSGAVRGWYAVRRADGAAVESGPVPFVVQAP